MTAPEILRAFAFAGVPVGLVLGLLLGPAASREGGQGGYGSFRRRANRLAHVAAVMLPALAGLYGLLLPGESAPAGLATAGAWLWCAGASALVATLLVAAVRPGVRYLLPLPALAVVAAAVLFGLGALSARGTS